MRPLGRINKEILKLALPSILANITIPLVGMVDLAVAGHLDAMEVWTVAQMIGGIAIGSMLFDLLYWNFTFLRVGTGGLVAQAYGKVISTYPMNVRRGHIPLDYHSEGALEECGKILLRALGVALGIGLVLIAIQHIFLKGAFFVVSCTPEVMELATSYFLIRIWAGPATLSMMALKGWFIGMQDSMSPMITDLVVNFTNIIASILLSRHIGFAGIAAGTVLAQYTGLVVATCIILFRYIRPVFSRFDFRKVLHSFEGAQTRKFFVMNTDLFFRSACFIAIYIGYTIISARYGDVLLSSATIMMKLLMIFSYFIDGFAYAGEAMAGKYIGAQNPRLLRSTVKYNFLWSGLVALIFVLLYSAGGRILLKIMTDDPTVLEASLQFIPWLVLMPVAGCAAFTWDGLYIGATASKPIRNSMLWATLAFYLVFFAGMWLTEDSSGAMGIHLLLAAYFAHLIARSIHLSIKAKRMVFTIPFA